MIQGLWEATELSKHFNSDL